MPVLFAGHGTPMNAVEENEFTKGWQEIAAAVEKPKMILAISAHWFTEHTRVQAQEHPKTIHDFYGFPEELYAVEYPAPGSPALAERVKALLPGTREDNTWGIDHGAWSVLKWMYPEADIPVAQLSVDARMTPPEVYAIGAALRPLRGEGVLIFGSGNVVHNLGRVDFDMQGGFPWAEEFDAYIRGCVESGDHDGVIDYQKAGDSARLAFRTPEHFNPLLYVLGAAGKDAKVRVFNNACTLGSLSMTSYLFGE